MLCLNRCRGRQSAQALRASNLATELDIAHSTYNVEGLGDNLPYKGIDYLGMGYDLIMGNPNGSSEAGGVDPGIRMPVAVVTTYEQDNVYHTTNNRHVQPVEGYAFPISACTMQTEVTEVTSASDYQDSLSVDAKVQAKGEYAGVKGKFVGSVGYNSFKQSAQSKTISRFQTVSYCLTSEVGFNPTHVAVPKDSFQTAAQALKAYAKTQTDSTLVQNKWNEFFARFGTHYMSVVRLGGKLTNIVVTDTSTRESTDDFGLSISAAIKLSAGDTVGKVSTNTALEEKAKKTLASMSTTESVIVVGGLPAARNAENPSEQFATWAPTVHENPMPAQFELVPLCCIGWANSQEFTGDIDDLDNYNLDLALINPRDYYTHLQAYEAYAATLAEERWKTKLLSQNVFDRFLGARSSQNSLNTGGLLLSTNKLWKLQLQESGHLVISQTLNPNAQYPTWTEKWSTEYMEDLDNRTTDSTCNHVTFSTEGVLSIYEINASSQHFLKWSVYTSTQATPPDGAYLVLEDCGELVCYNGSTNKPYLWKIGLSGTCPTYTYNRGPICTLYPASYTFKLSAKTNNNTAAGTSDNVTAQFKQTNGAWTDAQEFFTQTVKKGDIIAKQYTTLYRPTYVKLQTDKKKKDGWGYKKLLLLDAAKKYAHMYNSSGHDLSSTTPSRTYSTHTGALLALCPRPWPSARDLLEYCAVT